MTTGISRDQKHRLDGTTVPLQSGRREEREKKGGGRKKDARTNAWGLCTDDRHRISDNETSVRYRTRLRTKLSRRNISKRIRKSHYSLTHVAYVTLVKPRFITDK